MKSNEDIKIGIIGGSGLYELEGVKKITEFSIETPYGTPSDSFTILEINGKKVAFLPRHGKGHSISPTELPAQANIWALKKLGVKFLLSISAVGSLKEGLPPKSFVIPNQIIDRTRLRKNTFFENGVVGHVSFADPFCSYLCSVVESIFTADKKIPFKKNGTYVCMEGPAFSTRAESHLYRSWGADIIGMTALPEAKLAREAEMAYAQIAMVTDYDCWREEEEAVEISHILEVMKHNTKEIKRVLPKIIESIDVAHKSEAHTAAQFAVITKRDHIPSATWEKIALFYGKYFE